MSQSKEASQFLSRIAGLPKGPVSLDEVLQPSLHDEAELRKLFATDKCNARLRDIHVGLVDVFAAPSDIRTTRARIIKDDADRDAQHVLALPSSLRREEGSPAMVENLEAFKRNWSVFTESSLSQLADWSNVIAAGGSVQACLMPLPKAATSSKRAMRKYFHEKAFPSSDVDIFLYGLTVDEVCCFSPSIFFITQDCLGKAERKIITIYEAVRDSVPWDVTCVRTKHTISIHCKRYVALIGRSIHCSFQHNIRTVTSRLFFASTVLLLRSSRVAMSTRPAAPTTDIASGRIHVL